MTLPEAEADRVGNAKAWKFLFYPLNLKTLKTLLSLWHFEDTSQHIGQRNLLCVSMGTIRTYQEQPEMLGRDLPLGWSQRLGQCGSLGTFPEGHILHVFQNPMMDMVQ